MAGILDKKTRFMDTILTDRGRKELAKGELNFAFATFSDLGTFYESSVENPNIAEEAVSRIMLEAFSRYQDLVIPEFDADRNSFFPAGQFDIVAGKLVSISGSVGVVRGEDLIVSSSNAIGNSLESLQELRPLRSKEPLGRDSGFSLSQNRALFTISENSPIPSSQQSVKRLSNVESLWQDKKLTHVDNFKFLPPVNKGSTKPLKDYPKLEQPEPMTFSDLEDSLGVGSKWKAPQLQEITFEETSTDNNLVCQVWEMTSGSLNKLRVIDFGEFGDNDPFSSGKHVFFVGKLMNDDAGNQTFINLFTVVFD